MGLMEAKCVTQMCHALVFVGSYRPLKHSRGTPLDIYLTLNDLVPMVLRSDGTLCLLFFPNLRLMTLMTLLDC